MGDMKTDNKAFADVAQSQMQGFARMGEGLMGGLGGAAKALGSKGKPEEKSGEGDAKGEASGGPSGGAQAAAGG